MKRTALSMTGATIVLALVALSAFVAITRANPATGVTPTLLALLPARLLLRRSSLWLSSLSLRPTPTSSPCPTAGWGRSSWCW